MKAAWESWVESNRTTYNRVCLINNKHKMQMVENYLRQGIKTEHFLNDIIEDDNEVRLGGKEEVQAMVEKIKTDNPNIENELSDYEKILICKKKKRKPRPTDEKILKEMLKIKPDITIEDIKAVKCCEYNNVCT